MGQKGRINQASPYLCNLFHDRFSVSGRNTRNKSQLNLPKSILSTGQRSFAFLGAKEYNLVIAAVRRLLLPISANSRRTTLFRSESSRVTAVSKMVDY